MMEPQKFLKTSSLILLSLTISGCALFKSPKPIETIVTKTVIQKQNVPIMNRPKPVILNPVEFFVVTEENLEEFITDFKKVNTEFVIAAMSIKGYENMSLNVAELRRYINQQKSLIVYYEEAVKPKEETPPTPEK